MLVGYTPHSSVSWSATPGWWASAMIGRRRRYFAHARAAPPVESRDDQRRGVERVGELDRRVHHGLAGGAGDVGPARPWMTGNSSAASAISAIARTASTG